ncbi:hypothetical protein QFC20_004423 [Naganishia adeliensis]|uniref:Uncharacterized protein n=1 Tax=Naganishia adeliensis TaxID=92952 RepID=A0ACC2W0K7_9TREE|nr:hypothetical protein QFC20_004423 [Naganishia adeliensis]
MLRTTTASIARPLRSAANVTARRGYASHGPSYNAPSGYIFGEKVRRFTDASGKRYEQDYGHRKDISLRREEKSSPPAAGSKRVKEDWENIWYLGMFGGMAFAALVLTYKPDTSIQAWAYDEAKRRMVENGQWEQIKYRPSGESTIPASQ